ncbi:hypothetical protein GALL_71340 [mine drainage metagenome]|uniref:Uncharacterized protein n=1 Tax=mine drainage metagenome TaxID=410659 RepID=A0A1J5SSJ8_9ZZZZ
MKNWMQDLLKRIKEDLAKAHKSWTMWVNGMVTTLSGAWLYLLANPDALQQIQAAVPDLQQYMSAKVYASITAALGIVNLILRIKTSGRLAEK